MGSWMSQLLCGHNIVAVYDPFTQKTGPASLVQVIEEPSEAGKFLPDFFINCSSLDSTLSVFKQFLPFLNDDCILADIASVKEGLPVFYAQAARKYVSVHPMFGPTFGDMNNSSGLNAIIIGESDMEGKLFFKSLFQSLGIIIHEMNFSNHDRLMSEVLSVPYLATLLYASASAGGLQGGTTYNRHAAIASGLFTEDPKMLAGILVNRYTIQQIEKIDESLRKLKDAIERSDAESIRQQIEIVSARYDGHT